ncbi:HupE/UreJ family protein [Seongchinamella sediminis]|uniref:HupE/UreJ family protein n=1 Tax=Seongchinamella sediminis TaxID=2283635 RepID=A0A3L7DVE0_9GAMM|nr:HupE/UreJ family protein [Seongchinamella sediminis]RLQ21537.1 HupE/UreJ family protein [Seongchinamella sediminis]
MKQSVTVLLLVLIGLSLPAQAHRFAPSLLKVTEIGAGQYNLVWKTPAQATSNVPMRPQWPASCEVSQASAPQMEGTGMVTSLQLACSGLGDDGLVGETLGIDGLGPNQASAMVMVSLLDGRQYQQVLNAEQTDFVVPEEPGAGEVMSDYSVLGIEHIWGGIDHLLFVFGLLLLVGGGTRLLWTITAFTVGHSITLSLVTLGFFNYPVALVEFTIALSIFVLAVELTREGRNDIVWRNPWWLAGGFGLLHGMGFAGALAETGLPQDNVPLALLFFNVGIEIGQLSFILVMLAIWWLLHRPLEPWQQKLRWVPVYVLGGLSAMWCLERGLEVLA